MTGKHLLLLLPIFSAIPFGITPAWGTTPLAAGVAQVDISPTILPALRNGGFLQASTNQVDDPLMARCLVLANQKETLAIVVVDSCMLPRSLCDRIKQLASARCGIAPTRILIAATHTHSAPSVMNYCLGTRRDENYTRALPSLVADAIVSASARKQRAKIGWTRVRAPESTNCRRWIRRRDRVGQDPFGALTVRAMMHPGYQNPDYVCPAGPIDPWLSMLRVVSEEGEKPLCVLANFSMHYFGAGAGFSADYFGDVCRQLEQDVATDGFVAMMSQGTSGDLHWMDYSQPQRAVRRDEYARQITRRIEAALPEMTYHTNPEIGMLEQRITLSRRLPNQERLAWAKQLNDNRGEQPPRNQPEVYAEQATWIAKHPEEELVLQTIRVGELAFTAIPNEVYGITGLKLKQQSPFPVTVNFELANGAAGYIPPPSQHAFGGYTTWPARTAGLEEEAEPKIVETLLQMLEELAQKQRRQPALPSSPFGHAVRQLRPDGYWRLDDLQPERLRNEVQGPTQLMLTGRAASYLEGATHPGLSGGNHVNRAMYFADGQLSTAVGRHSSWSLGCWFWHGAPSDGAEIVGTLIAMGSHTLQLAGQQGEAATRLLLTSSGEQHRGGQPIAARRWYWLVMSVSPETIRVYLDGDLALKLDQPAIGGGGDKLCLGSDLAQQLPFDGKFDEVSLWHRALSSTSIAGLWDAAIGNISPQPAGSGQR